MNFFLRGGKRSQFKEGVAFKKYSSEECCPFPNRCSFGSNNGATGAQISLKQALKEGAKSSAYCQLAQSCVFMVVS